MHWTPHIKTTNGKAYVFCDWRRKFVRATPEENVRQTFLHALTEDNAYPKSLIAVEHPVRVGELGKRCDAVVLSSDLLPLCIIEFKAPEVTLSQEVFDQVAVYNRRLHVPFFIIANGKDTLWCRVTPAGYEPHPGIPPYQTLLSVLSTFD